VKKIVIYTFVMLLASLSAKAEVEKPVYGQSFAPLVEKLMPKVVNIVVTKKSVSDTKETEIYSQNKILNNYFLQDDGGNTSLGSGFLIDAKGYIVTNNHVVEDAWSIVVRLADNRQFDAVLVGADKLTDLALIKIDADTPFDFAKLGDSDKTKVGDWTLAIGNPFGLGGSVSAGIISAKSRDIDAGSYDNFIQTDASINQGSSGGPLFDMNGEVVGVNTAIFSSTGASMGIGFATPVNLVKFVVEQLIANGKVERGWIGIKVTDNEQEIVLSDNQNFVGGAVVSSLSENAPAAKSEIEVGDIIIGFNGKDVLDAKHFSRSVAETKAGSNIILRIWRNHQLKDLNMGVELMPEENVAKVEADGTEKNSAMIDDLGLIVEDADGRVRVAEVFADGKAIDMGVKAGDEVQKVDGNDVVSANDLNSFVDYAKQKGNDTVALEIVSDDTPQTLTLGLDQE